MCVDTQVVVIKGRKLMIPLPSETADKVQAIQKSVENQLFTEANILYV